MKARGLAAIALGLVHCGAPTREREAIGARNESIAAGAAAVSTPAVVASSSSPAAARSRLADAAGPEGTSREDVSYLSTDLDTACAADPGPPLTSGNVKFATVLQVGRSSYVLEPARSSRQA